MVQGRKPQVSRKRMQQLRAQGLTYAAIGKRLGVTKQAIHLALTKEPRVEPDRAGLAQRLQALRRAAGLTRTGLARKISRGFEVILRAERGQSWPVRKTLERLAKVLGVAVAELTGEESLPVSRSATASQGHAADGKRGK